MIAVAAQSAFAASLLCEATGQTVPHDDWPPPLGELLCDRQVPDIGWTPMGKGTVLDFVVWIVSIVLCV